MGDPTMWMTRESLDALKSLTGTQRRAVRFAVLEWHAVARSEGYEPSHFWRGFNAYVMQSAALGRLLSGSPLFVDRPPAEGGYPAYDAMTEQGAAVRIRLDEEVSEDD